VLVWLWAASAFADDHIHGMITGLGAGGTVFVQTDAATLLVAVSDATDIHRLDGIRPVRASSAELIPGLRVRVAGEYAPGGKFIAEKVTFTKEDFRTAAAIQSGLLSTTQPSATSEQRIAATSGALAATDPRKSSLDDFTPLRSITVYFGDGKYAVSRDQKAQLQQLARDAQGVHGYMIQVAAYASDVGPESSNQKLSMERERRHRDPAAERCAALQRDCSRAHGRQRAGRAQHHLERTSPEPQSRRHAAAEQGRALTPASSPRTPSNLRQPLEPLDPRAERFYWAFSLRNMTVIRHDGDCMPSVS
jgi:outer membrane protein OmpA-like peptidoglycan-associated protein